MNRVDAYRMVRRRTADAGFRVKLGCHVFRATGITADLEAGGTLENVQRWRRTKAGRSRHDSTAPIGDAVRLGSDPNSWNPVKRAKNFCAPAKLAGNATALGKFSGASSREVGFARDLISPLEGGGFELLVLKWTAYRENGDVERFWGLQDHKANAPSLRAS